MLSHFANVEAALEDLRQGKMLILVDDEDRENEGDLVIAAEKVTASDINFMSKYGRGLICMPMSGPLIERLALPMMVSCNNSPYNTAFTVSIEAKQGVSTGISAYDRAHTIQTAIRDDVTPQDIVSPGHIFPLKANDNGVLARKGQTEGSVDLMRLAGLKEAAVICEVLKDDGTMARRPDLEAFAKEHQVRIVSVEEIIAYRFKHDNLISELASSPLPLEDLGLFTIKVFGNVCDEMQHIALIKAPFSDEPLVRIHSECLTGDIFGSTRCDCGSQLSHSLETIASKGGILLYMRQEGRGIGLVNKIKAYQLQHEKGLDTVEANHHLGLPTDNRDYAISAQILKYLDIAKVKLLTNNPKKIQGLKKYGIDVKEREPVVVSPTEDNSHYLKTKQEKLGHLFSSIKA